MFDSYGDLFLKSCRNFLVARVVEAVQESWIRAWNWFTFKSDFAEVKKQPDCANNTIWSVSELFLVTVIG